jgi:hypothetical protein
MPSKTEALRRLTNTEAMPEHQADFDRHVSSTVDDRGACLIIVAQIDVELDKAIEHKLGKLTTDVRAELYERDGPLATFARKITMAVALGILGPVSRENLRIIRHVRNAFALAKQPIKYSTPEVSAMCADLRIISTISPSQFMSMPEGANPKSVFEAACAPTMMRLATYYGAKLHLVVDDIKQPIMGGPLP